MANPYATIENYTARYGGVGDSAAERIGRLLDDAALFLDAAVDEYGIDAVAKADALELVCCARARYLEERGDGSASRTQQAGPYSYTVSYTKPPRDFRSWLRDEFGALLGISEGGVACVPLGFGEP
ncbi:MAG: hypothetical protein IJ087_00475 [Eggerthellaceae bacterium]|nr:hypothetical protein [Eggerthellaceae bacterium]